MPPSSRNVWIIDIHQGTSNIAAPVIIRNSLLVVSDKRRDLNP